MTSLTAQWSMLGFAAWCEASSVCSALFLAKASQKSSSRFGLRAWHLNALFIGLFGFVLFGVLRALPRKHASADCAAVFAVAAAKFGSSWQQLERLQESLGVASASWQPGQAFFLRPEWLPMLDALDNSFQAFCRLQQAGYGCFCALLVAVVGTFVPSAFGHIRLLKVRRSSHASLTVQQHVHDVSDRFKWRRTALTPAQVVREEHQVRPAALA